MLIRAITILIACILSVSCDRNAPTAEAPDTVVVTPPAPVTSVPPTAPISPAAPLPAPAAPAADSAKTTIVLLLQDASIPLQDFQRNGLTMLVSRQAACELTVHDAVGNAVQQTEQFRQAIAAKPSAIIVSPVAPPALAAVIVEAKTAGVPVIGLDRRMLDEGCASIVFSDQRRVGRMAAEAVLEALKRKATLEGRAETTGRVVQIRGVEDSFPTNEMSEGFANELKKEPGVILVHDAAAQWKPENATQRVAEAFRLQKQFDVIFTHNDALAIGAAKAATEAGQRDDIFIIGTDGLTGTKRGLELVLTGDIDATIVQPALVDLALQIVLKMRDDKNFKPQPAYEIEPFAVVPKNVEPAIRVGTYKLPPL